MPAVALCSLEDVKNILREIQNADWNTFLISLIAGFSGNADVNMLGGAEGAPYNRIYTKGTYTEYFSSDGYTRKLNVKAFPIQSITGLWIDTNGVWDAGTLQPANSYIADRRGGPWIHAWYTWFPYGIQHIKVTYQGGLFTTTGDVHAPLRMACATQVAFWWRNRDRLGIISEGMQGGSFTRFAKGEFLPEIKAWLAPYRNFAFSVQNSAPPGGR